MSPPLYDVILTDQIAPGCDRSTVVAALARLLGRDERQVADLMHSGEQIIKSNVDVRTGQAHMITNPTLGYRSVRWSPDSTQLLFTGGNRLQTNLYVATLPGYSAP